MRYASPFTVDEAQALLAGSRAARVFAGATDLIPQMRAGLPEPELMIDLKRIDRLCAISRDDAAGAWTVGAAAPTADICARAGLAAAFPGLVEASGLIGSDQIQNRSSWGGNLANASPAADTPPSLIVNEALAVIAGRGGGARTVPVADVVVGPGATSLADDELIVEFVLADPPAATADAYLRLIPRTEMDIAVVGAAARVTLDDAGRVGAAAIALGAVAPTVVRVPAAEAALIAREPDDADSLAAVASAASEAADPIDDKRGTVAYRRQVAGVLARRAVAIAARRAGHSSRAGDPSRAGHSSRAGDPSRKGGSGSS